MTNTNVLYLTDFVVEEDSTRFYFTIDVGQLMKRRNDPHVQQLVETALKQLDSIAETVKTLRVDNEQGDSARS